MALPADYVDNGVTGKPDMSRLMIPSHTLPENYSFDADAMEGFEMEYGDGENFKSTTLFWKLPVLCDGEELLWSYVGEQGVFNKKARHLMAVTNFRAYVYHFEEHDWGNVLINTLDDILVMNSHRQSSSHRMGSFHSNGRMGMRIGTHSSMGSSRSQTMGDVHFMKDGETIITFGDVSDPHGIVKLVKSIQKQVTIRDKIPEIELPEEFKNTTVPKEVMLELSKLSIADDKTEYVQRLKKELEKNPDNILFDLLFAELGEIENWNELEKVSRKMIKEKNYENAFVGLCTSLFKIDTDSAIKELNVALNLFPENTILLDYKKQVTPYEENSLKNKLSICTKCGKENESGSKFCNKCGSKMDVGCEKCGNVNPKNSKFCNGCGSTLV